VVTLLPVCLCIPQLTSKRQNSGAKEMASTVPYKLQIYIYIYMCVCVRAHGPGEKCPKAEMVQSRKHHGDGCLHVYPSVIAPRQ
jgi:hypothetical protein